MPDVLLTRDGRPAAELWPTSGLVHLNHGSYGRVPLAASQQQRRLAGEMERGPLAFMAAGPERIAAARAAIAPHLGVDAAVLALVPNASAGVSTALRSLPLSPGAEVLVTDHAYGAVRMGVERTAREAGAQVRTAQVPLEAGTDDAVDAIWSEVTDRTEMIVLDQITSPTARLFPVGKVCARARERGILTIVDGAHAPLLLTDPARDAGADVWVGNLHKFGCTPRGTAALVAHENVADRLRPLIDSWGAPDPYPSRFDWQASDDYTPWLAAPASLQHLEDEVGWAQIRTHASAMTTEAVSLLGDAIAERCGIDARVDVGMPLGPIQLVELPADRVPDPAAARADLAAAGFEVQLTGHADRLFWRLALHAYTTGADLEAMLERALPILLDR